MRVLVQTSTGALTVGSATVSEQVTIISTGLVGPQGPQGPSGSALTVIAAEVIGGQRAITTEGLHCAPETSHQLAGISLNAASIGGAVEYLTQGGMQESSWSWIPSLPIFIGAAGVLTQTPPTSGVSRIVGWAVTPTRINVDFAPIFTLA